MMTALATSRLLLRPLSAEDEALYCRLYGDPAVMGQVGAPQPIETARRGFANALAMNAEPVARRRFWVMQDRVGGNGRGLIGLSLDEPGSAEVGVLLDAESQGQGLASEAIAALANHAFGELSLQRLHTRHASGHSLAAGLMRALGFEATARQPGVHGWRWQLDAQAWTAASGDKAGSKR